jgi:hypothetical protein
MGTEFLNRTKKTIAKRIDLQRAALATPVLFTIKPGDRPRSYVATIVAGTNVAGGESLIAEVRNGSVKMRRGNEVVVSLDNPPSEVIAGIENSGGVANGIVQRVHKLSGKADVTLC